MLMLYLTYMDDESDKSKFEKMYLSYRKQMVLLAMSYLHNEDEAEDAVHNVFLRIAQKCWETVADIKSDEDLRNYLMKATKNEALNIIEAKRNAPRSFDTVIEYGVDETEELSDDTFTEFMCNRVEYEHVVEAIQSLDDKYRWTLYYHFVMGLSAKETAKALNQTVTTTKQQLIRGKKMLLELLEREGVGKHGN